MRTFPHRLVEIAFLDLLASPNVDRVEVLTFRRFGMWRPVGGIFFDMAESILIALSLPCHAFVVFYLFLHSFSFVFSRTVCEDVILLSRNRSAEHCQPSGCNPSLPFTGLVGRVVRDFVVRSRCEICWAYGQCFVGTQDTFNVQGYSKDCSCHPISHAVLAGNHRASGNLRFQLGAGELPGVQKCQDFWSKG